MKHLLLIANSDYINIDKLKSVDSDVVNVENTFASIGYSVTKLLNKTKSELVSEVKSFLEKIKEDDILIIYYTGHGCNYHGHNYIQCIDYKEFNGVPEDFAEIFNNCYEIEKEFENELPTSRILLVVDACRNSLDIEGWNESSLVRDGFSSLYSTTLYKYAYGNSLFCTAFCETCKQYGLTISEICSCVSNCVKKNCDKREEQYPIFISGDIDFVVAGNQNEVTEAQDIKVLNSIYKTYRELGNDAETKDVVEMCEIAVPYTRVDYAIKNLFRRNSKLGFIEALIRRGNYSLIVYRDRVVIKGLYTREIIENEGLYDFDDAVTTLEQKASKKTDFTYYIEEFNAFYINVHECSDEDFFQIRIESDKPELVKMVAENAQFNELMDLLHDNNIIITHSRNIFVAPILKKILETKDDLSGKILHINYIENISDSMGISVDTMPMDELFFSELSYGHCMERIIKNVYKTVIISLDAYWDSKSEDILPKLQEIAKTSLNNNGLLILYTDFVSNALTIFPLVKEMLRYVDYEIHIEKESDEILITNINKIKK